MLEFVLFAGSMIAALLMGAAVLGAVGGNRRWRGYAKMDETAVRALDTAGAAFEPLQMEPFTLSWPSEIERRSTRIDEPPWPSETWEDEYFGVRSREDMKRVREESIRLERQRDEAYRKEAMRQREHQAHSRHTREDQAAQRRQERQRRAEAQREQGARAEQEAEKQFFEEPASAALDAEDIAALVREHGLAGAVEQIRARTGWDFRQAAQFLANTLRDQ